VLIDNDVVAQVLRSPLNMRSKRVAKRPRYEYDEDREERRRIVGVSGKDLSKDSRRRGAVMIGGRISERIFYK
jgi:hypothetical protein